MNRTILQFIIILLLAVNTSLAGTPDSTYRLMRDTLTFRSLLKSYTTGLKSLECDFVQKKSMNIFTEPVVSQGYFCYKDAVMVRWEYKDPFQYLVIINNGRMFIKDNDKTNTFDLTTSESFTKLNTILGKILQGNVLNDKNDFSCSFYENDLNYKLVLVPKAKDIRNFIKDIDLYLEKKQFSVSRLLLDEVSGDNTDILFNNRKINIEISDDKFIVK